MMTSPIIPAIIPQSFDDLESQITKISHLHEVHVDVVDGVFVPALSWPHNTPHAIPAAAYDLLAPFSLEVDLMVEDQWGAAEAWMRAGADQLVFHVEVMSPALLEQFITEYDVTIGIASNNDTPVAALAPYIPFVSYVQVMGIAAIGTQGQPFDERVIGRIQEIQTLYPTLPISIDGSMNVTTLPRIAPLHLSRIIVGSAIMSHEDPLAAYRQLTDLVRS